MSFHELGDDFTRTLQPGSVNAGNIKPAKSAGSKANNITINAVSLV